MSFLEHEFEASRDLGSGASSRIRTHAHLLTKQPLWPTELYWQNGKSGRSRTFIDHYRLTEGPRGLAVNHTYAPRNWEGFYCFYSVEPTKLQRSLPGITDYTISPRSLAFSRAVSLLNSRSDIFSSILGSNLGSVLPLRDT